MTVAVEVRSLAKRYRSADHTVEALRGVDLRIPAGTVFGLLGPNGAGKSTLLRILTGLVRATSGEISIFGAPLTPIALARIGALVESPGLYPYLTGRETLELLARFHSAPRALVEPLLDRVGLVAAGDRRVDRYSLGMKQRLGIAAALIGDPEIVILDEPTNGMDPAGIRDMRRLLRELCDVDGRTVVISSHLLDEVQRTCDQVAILSEGRIVADDSIARLNGAAGRVRIEASPIEAVLERFGARARREGDAAVVQMPREEAPEMVASLAAEGVRIFEVRWLEADMEEIYFAKTQGRQCP